MLPEPVTLSEAKGLLPERQRFFATRRMTTKVQS
jgi:hypothetical protein